MATPRTSFRIPPETRERIDAVRGDESLTAWVLGACEQRLTRANGVPPPPTPGVVHLGPDAARLAKSTFPEPAVSPFKQRLPRAPSASKDCPHPGNKQKGDYCARCESVVP